jgi:predicted unusual protein kinase regulating ubiquinone biosynthesis (AarF/ABC1/UbiB family)
MLDELEKQVMGEFDYRKEAAQMELVRKNMLCFKTLVKVRIRSVSTCSCCTQ